MQKPAIFMMTMLAMTLTFGGCYSPGGGLFSASGGPQTYTSDELMQKTITMTDTRNGEVFFGPMDIPAGKQLTFDFDPGEGDDPVRRPDMLRWELLDRGTRCGKLHNALTVPNGVSRKIDVTIRRGVQYASEGPQRPLRTDELNDRPDWWTPEGGPLPTDKRSTIYDN